MKDKEITPKYSESWNMTFEEIEKWEKEQHCLHISDGSGGLLEVKPMRVVDKDGNYGNEELLHFTSVDQAFTAEVPLLIADRNEIIKLRDYLNRFLQKTEFWVK